MKLGYRIVLALSPIVVAACGVHTDKAVTKAAIDNSSTSQRKKAYEATAQIMDEDGAVVDELYSVMRLHPKSMDRFMADASTDLDQKWIAKNMAGYLTKNPAGLEEVLLAAVPAVEKEPKARIAMNKALAAKSDQTADILTDDPHAMAKVIKSLLTVTEKKPAARKNMITAIHEDREAIMAFVKEDKPLAKAIALEFLREELKDKPTLEKVIAATGALDQPKGAPAPAPPPPPGAKTKSDKPLTTPLPQPTTTPSGGGPTPPPALGK